MSPAFIPGEAARAARSVQRALEITSTLIERRHPRAVEQALVSIAVNLRQALGVLDRAGLPATTTPTPRPVTLPGLALMLAHDPDAPVRLRAAASAALEASREGPPTPAQILNQLVAWTEAAQVAVGLSPGEAAERLAQTEAFGVLGSRNIRRAYALHSRATRIVAAAFPRTLTVPR